MALTLYGYWRSSASYRVRIALNIKQLAYEYVPVNLIKDGGGQHSQAYQQLNPSRLVPTLVDSDTGITLNQSMAIIEYLDEKYTENHSLLPSDISDRAKVRMLTQDIGCDIQPIANLRVLNKLRVDYHADDKQVNAWIKHWIETGFTGLTSKLVPCAETYCFGNTVSLADICLVPQVYAALRFGVNMHDFPMIYAIYNRCLKLEAFVDASPENQIDASF